LILVLTNPTLAQAQAWSGIIEPNRATDWTSPGVAGGIPNRTTLCATLNPGATAAQINSAIASCPANQVVFLNAGTYNLSSGITFGSKSNVTLRGAGADRTLLVFSNGISCQGLPSTVCIMSAGVSEESPPNSTTWTAGYAVGTTVITVGSTSGMQVGRILILDQLNDSSDGGGIFVCSTTNCSDEGGNAPGRNNRGQLQLVKVAAINGNQVTITPPLRMPNWRASQSPGVWWNGSAPMVTGNGVEDLTVNVSAATGENGIVMLYVSDCWVKGIRTINPDRSHVWLYKSMRITVRNNYFYGGQGDHSQSYGVEGYATGLNLVENNILQHVTGPIKHNGSETGSVVGYNFSIDDNYTAEGSAPGWVIPTVGLHEVGISHLLHEGNDGLGLLHDDIHGTTHFITVFRNHFYGDVWNNPPKTDNTAVINIASYGRFYNIIGNVLGRTGYYNTYQANLTESPRAIYALGWSPESAVPDDPRTAATMFRWGNYDTVNNAVRFLASEVPSADSFFANPVPASQTLPPSMYLSGPPSFWSTPWGTPPWPPIGPDVTGGNIAGWGGHANKIPARLCYENTPKTNGILNFNASTCYSSTAAPRPNPPTNLTILVQ
jgi:hypothetical protein